MNLSFLKCYSFEYDTRNGVVRSIQQKNIFILFSLRETYYLLHDHPVAKYTKKWCNVISPEGTNWSFRQESWINDARNAGKSLYHGSMIFCDIQTSVDDFSLAQASTAYKQFHPINFTRKAWANVVWFSGTSPKVACAKLARPIFSRIQFPQKLTTVIIEPGSYDQRANFPPLTI